MNRTLSVVRLQLVNKQTYLWVPLLVLGGALLITMVIFALLPVEGIVGGGAQAPMWYFLVVGVQSLTLTFPFSQALSVTRREFYLGTMLTALLASTALAVIYVLGGLLEGATGGFGTGSIFFQVPGVWDEGWAGAGLVYLVLSFAFFQVGFFCATIYKRFGAMVLTTGLILLALLLLAGVWLVTRLEAWGRFWGWVAETGVLGLTLWSLPLLAVLALVSYASLRLALP
ncbi:hypothetical protein [Serinicoccus kebangsaanensis]|uniref:hypothetical protein n=1 Tax=Serinicoccus kebangsaanensis TaxID=2602069 RepID=UPI00124CED6D|nr:hypothetical protein [Serinicoccus kebangsaanensis]